MNRNWRNLLAGIILVPVLHWSFGLLALLISAIIGSGNIISIILNSAFLFVGLTQFFYLIPVMLHYRRRREFEVIKGISIGAIVTILLNGACYGAMFVLFDMLQFAVGAVMIAIFFMLMTFYLFNRRSTQDRQL
jgi:Na+/proline symporter